MARLEPFPLYHASGSHRELGRQHGEQAREQIRTHLASLQRSTGLATARFEARALRFRPLFTEYCPHLLEEVEGLAEGAGVTLAGALAVNIRGALGVVPDEGCTAFVVGRDGTASGEALIGQNSDMLAENLPCAYVLRLEPDDKPAILIWTFGGMIGYHGLNGAGVAHFANDLGDGGPARRFGLPHYPVKRLMLECRSVAEVVALLRRVPLWFNGNYVLCDGQGAMLDVEATSAGPEIIGDDGRGYIVHANHYRAPRYATAENAAATYADSFPRQDRIDLLLAERYGALTVDDMAAILADHSDYPAAICRHSRVTDGSTDFETAGVTVAALIAEPERGRLHVAPGNPCLNPFTTYALDA
ncbi:MAG: C45 family autoproteolytic acyltransferase/hydrolase [Candidatus Limnocylindria bacterium]